MDKITNTPREVYNAAHPNIVAMGGSDRHIRGVQDQPTGKEGN